MAVFENRHAAYVWVREYRKRRRPPFAGRHHLKYQHTRAADAFMEALLLYLFV